MPSGYVIQKKRKKEKKGNVFTRQMEQTFPMVSFELVLGLFVFLLVSEDQLDYR